MSTNSITIFVRVFTGSSKSITIDLNAKVSTLVEMLYNLRDEKYKETLLENYIKAFDYMISCRLLKMTDILVDQNVVNHSTIMQIPRSWTMTENFNWNTLTLEDEITEEIAEHPYKLNPGCGHVFDIKTIIKHVTIKQNNNLIPYCPKCRHPITQHVIKNLSDNLVDRDNIINLGNL